MHRCPRVKRHEGAKPTARHEEVVLPVVEEEVAVGKRTRPIERVRVHKHVVEREVPLELVSAHEVVEIERVSIDREVPSVPETRVEGNTTIVPVIEETYVVQKRLVLREEIRITKHRSEHKRHVRAPAKREDVTIEREMSGQELRGRQR